MELLIRTVRPEDLEAVTAVEAACFPSEEAAGRGAMARRISAMPEWFLVAEADGVIAGHVDGPVIPSGFITDDLFATGGHDPAGRTLAILGLAVSPAFRRQGIAGRLLREYLRAGRTAGMDRAVLTCKARLIPYYEKFGFVSRGVSRSVHGGAVWYDMEALLRGVSGKSRDPSF